MWLICWYCKRQSTTDALPALCPNSFQWAELWSNVYIYIYYFYVSSNPFVQFECQNYWNIPKPLLSVNISHWTSLGVHVFLTECVTLSVCVSQSLCISISVHLSISPFLSLSQHLFLRVCHSQCVCACVCGRVSQWVSLSHGPTRYLPHGVSQRLTLMSLTFICSIFHLISSVKSNTHHSLGDAESTWPNQEPTFGTEHCSTLINIICWRSNLEYGPGPSSLRQVRYLRSHGYTKQLY